MISGTDVPQAQTSAIIPVRNGVRFVAEAVTSVLRQLGSDDEVVVVDDASVDGTPVLLAAIGDPRLRVLTGSGRGVSAARNLGLATARGEFVAFLDSDDFWPPSRHHVLLDALQAHPARGASFGRVRVRFESGIAETTDAQGLDGKHICELVGSGLYRRALVSGVGGFCEQMHLREDADFHIRLLEGGLDPLLCEVDSLVYRRHAANVTNDSAAVRLALVDVLRRKLARQKNRTREDR
jgi:glycosyltransferase involved in cell wall biosynthesis